MKVIKHPITVTGTFCNGDFIVSSFSILTDKVCLVYKQGTPEKAANKEIGVQGLRYRVVTEEFDEELLVRRKRALWREGDAWYIEKQVEDESL